MSLNPSEISKLIKAQIRNVDKEVEMNESGTVLSVGDGIANVYGLKNAMMSELLLFPHDVYGMVLNLEEDQVGVVLMSDNPDIKEGDTVKRTGHIVEVPVGDGMLGRVVNALGEPIDGKGLIEGTRLRPVERVAPGVMTRKSVSVPLQLKQTLLLCRHDRVFSVTGRKNNMVLITMMLSIYWLILIQSPADI